MTIIETLRQFRVGLFAVFDFAVSYAAFYVAAPLLIRGLAKMNMHLSRANILWLVLPLSVLTHILVGTYTPLTKMVLDPSGHYLAKVLMLVMVYLGVR